MTEARKHQILTFFIASVWFINGFYCKVLNLVPRHRQIVGRIVGYDGATLLTVFIGILEVSMAVWILSNIQSRLNAFVQISLVAFMNTLEFILVPDLLLWGRANAFFALMFIFLIFYNEHSLNKKLVLK